MIKRLSALLLSVSLLSTQFVAVKAEETTQKTETKYYTDRFIVETVANTGISTFSASDTTSSEDDIAVAINDVLPDVETASNNANVYNVTNIEENSSVVTLSEEVSADEFTKAVKDTLGKNVTVQPDYPVYMSLATISTISETATDTTTEAVDTTATATPSPRADWDKSLANAEAISTGESARIAVLGGYFEKDTSSSNQQNYDYIVDGYNVVGAIPYYNTMPSSSSTINAIHSIAPQAKIIPIGVFGCEYAPEFSGVAYTSDIVKGIAYARNKGAQVIVGDWRSSQYNAYLESKIKESGILFITSAAAGETTDYMDSAKTNPIPDKEYPACFDIDNVLTVGYIKDNYNKYCVTPYDDDIDLYAMERSGNYYMTPATAAAAAAALIIGKNNSSDNLKDILTKSAATISYLPGTKNAEKYKAVDFYDAVMGNTSSKNINVTTPRSDDSSGGYLYRYDSLHGNIIYTDIEQIDGGAYAAAALTKAGKVILTTDYTNNYLPTDMIGTIYPSLKKHGVPVEVPGLSDIAQIAMTEDGRGLVALNKDGDVYLYGSKYALGVSSDKKALFTAPFKCENIENVESIYATTQKVWVQKKDALSKHTETYEIRTSEDGNITFSKIEAATDAKIRMSKNVYYYGSSSGAVYFIKDGKVYMETTSDTDGISYPEVSSITGNIVDIIPSSNGIYTLDKDGTMTDPHSVSSNSNTSQYIYNVTQMEGVGSVVVYRSTNDDRTKVRLTNGGTYDYNTKISSNTKIKSVCGMGNDYHALPYPYRETLFILTENGTLYYIPGSYTSPGPMNNIGSDAEIYTGIAAQSNFESGSVNSVIPTTINMEYGLATSDLQALLTENTYDRATITLEDGTDISVPVQWDISNYDPNQLGKQTFEGELTLPKNITNTKTLKAEANVIIRTPINAVENFDLGEVDFGTPLSDIESQLAKKAKVWTTKPYGNNEEPIQLDVVWDTSNYKSDEPGTYTINGTLQIPNDLKNTISNTFNKRPVTTVKVKSPLPPVKNITDIPTVTVNVTYDTPLSDLELPTQVAVNLDGENIKKADVSVTWEPETTYDPTLSGKEQKFIGTMTLPEDIKNPNEIPAILNVIVMPEATGKIIDIETVYLDADQGVPFEQIPDLPKEVKVTVEDNKTAMIPVTWENTYDEMLITTKKPQKILGEVDLTNTMIENSDNTSAIAMISTNKANYVVKSISPSSAKMSVEFGTSLDKLLSDASAPKQVTVNLEKENDSSKTLSLNMNLEILSEDNKGYNAESTGLHNVIARPVLPSNVKAANDMYFMLYVDVKPKHQVTKLSASPHLSTYRYTPANELDTPETIKVQLDGDENNTADIKVKWDMDEYYSDTVGRNIILGEFIEIPNNINIPSKFVPSMSITVEDAEYEIVQFTGAGAEEIYAGYTIEEVAEKLSVNEAEAEIKMVGSNYVTHTNIPVIMNYSEQNYDREQDATYVLMYTPDPPEGISNVNNEKYYFTLQTTMVDVDKNELDEFPIKEVIRGTAYEALNLPEEMPIKLENGKTEMINMNWDSKAYDPDSDGCMISSNPDWPAYINHDGVDITYNIVFFDEEDVYTLTSIEPSQLPATGAYDVKLGTSLEEIKNMLDTDEIKVIASKGSDTIEKMVKFEILAEDNAEYLNASTAGKYKIKARLILPDDIHDTKEEQTMLIINVKAYTRTVKTISTVTKRNIPYGTPFNELGLPEQVKVTFTDGGEPEMINVIWDQSEYLVDSTAKYHRITGELDKPAYVEVPSGKTAIAMIYMKSVTKAQLLSVTPKEETALFSLSAMFRLNKENELPDDVVEHKYIAEYLNEDGTITTEEFSTFEVIGID